MSTEYVNIMPPVKSKVLLRITFGDREGKKTRYPEDWLVMNPNRYYGDRKNWTTQIHMLLEQWNYANIVISIEPSLLASKRNFMRENALLSVLDALYIYPKETPKIYVYHSGAKRKWIAEMVHMSNLIHQARTVATSPGNVATPVRMMAHVATLFQNVPNCTTRSMMVDDLEKEGLNLITGVGESAMNAPGMSIVERKGLPGGKTICIVGKGITFDTGGLALKPDSDMRSMKFDKIGAVYGAYALRHLVDDSSLKQHTLIGIFPFAENAVSGKSMRPGDVIKSYSGKTVEISNPDAEGRLILADAFSYAKRYKPQFVLDLATLTGHADSINCWHSGYYYAIPKWLKMDLEDVTNDIGERMLPMPTWTNYTDVLKSPVADLMNSPDTCSDAFVAAMFLREFLPPKCDWLHIDLAHEYGRAGLPKGRGIRTLVEAVQLWSSKAQ